MTPLVDIALSQAQLVQAPPPGSSPIENVAYLLTVLLGLLGVREGTYWVGKLREKRSGKDLEEKIDDLHTNQLEHVHVTGDVAKTLDRFESDTRAELRSIRDRLADVQARMNAQ